MGRIPQDVIDQVLSAHDVVEVVGRYVPLVRAGSAFKALCPFHEEKTPSFTVNPDRQSFKCFGCGKGGNVFGFLIEHEGLTFPEAVRLLAKERGIVVPEARRRSPEEEGRVTAVRRALDFAQAFFTKSLSSSEGQQARAYLEHRGYTPEAASGFGLGYAPPGWDRLLQAAAARRLPAAVLADAGLVLERKEGGHYDRFRHRITFPIADLQGRVLTFGARALGEDDQPKYLNGPETLVFKKANVLYGLDRARNGVRETGEALLMEGYTDVLMCHLHGLDRAVAGMGTAFTPRQAALLRRFAKRVVLVYDADDAGRQAAERTLDILLAEGLDVRVALLPQGRDIDEILLEEGREAVDSILANALDLLAFKFDLLAERHDLSTPAGRARAGEALVATIVRVPSAIERDQLLAAVAERLGGPRTEAALRDEAARVLGTAAGRGAASGGGGRSGVGRVPEPTMAARVLGRTRRDAEESLLAGLLFFPSLRPDITRAVAPEDFADPVLGRVYNAVLGLEQAGKAYDVRAVAARLADDPEAQSVLAGLPEDPTLEERIPFQIQFLERRRREDRRSREILRRLDGETSGEGAPSSHGDPWEGGSEPLPEPTEGVHSSDDGIPWSPQSTEHTG
ncbi:MAG: DNA primase [Planctomycetota bacterium]|jgi:DNA primase